MEKESNRERTTHLVSLLVGLVHALLVVAGG